ncbi:MAG: hypothetical protein ACI87O_002368 [Planctomycetota bacterium]
MTESQNDGHWEALLQGNELANLHSELDLVAELEGLASTENDRFLALECLQAESAERMGERLELLGRAGPAQRLAVQCQSVLRERAAFIDADYLRIRSAELLARDEGLGNGVLWEQDFPCDLEWVKDRIEEALSDVLLEDEELYSDGLPAALGDDFHHYCLVHSFAVELHTTLEASVRFHRLPDETRRAFFALLVDRYSVERCVEMGLGPRHRLKIEVRSALKALLFLEDLWPSIQIPERNTGGEYHARS